MRFWNSSFRENLEEEVYFLGVGVLGNERGDLCWSLFQESRGRGLA